MPAYVLAEIEITNPDGYKEYTAMVPATIEKYGGRFLVRGGKAHAMEGDWPGRRRVIVEFPSIEAAERYIRTISAPFGPHTDAEWRFLTEHVVRQKPDGTYRVHYDPALAVPFNAAAPHQDIDLWPVWERVRCPTLVIRGELSDLLSRETAERMKTSGPHAQVIEIPGVGHAPTLMQPDQIAIVRDFLLAG